ncbi:MAG: Ig-like domain-containing protein [Alphaproteobacteria bacterium]|nr:Ig-like domain-containing protein [Alphaproteobacteria bacterium]
MLPPLALFFALTACTGKDPGPDSGGADGTTDSGAVDAWQFWPEAPGLRGPGGPTTTFTEDQLWTNCAYLDGGDNDFNHHNLIVPYRGHLLMPWSPEFGTGGISFFDVSDPCNPQKAGEGWTSDMRESHALGFFQLGPDSAHEGEYMVATGLLGIIIWDVGDLEAPAQVSYLPLPDVFYPDAYTYVVLSVSVQYPWVYVAAADNGIFVVDISDPTAPVMAAQHVFEPALRAGGVFAIGNLLMVSSAEQTEAVLMDISIPDEPQPLPGGRFTVADSTGEGKEFYHANHAGDLAFFARKQGGGGFMMYDISDPTAPTYAGDILTEGNGGYVFHDEGLVFVGESSFSQVYDIADPGDIQIVGRGDLTGDLDTLTPYGNVAILSVDQDADSGQASAVMPWTTAPDTTPVHVRRVVPADGEAGVALTSRVAVVFDEMIEPGTVYPGSLRLLDADGMPVPGVTSVQEGTATYSPVDPLSPNTTYTFEVDQVTDVSGNAMDVTVTTSFSTVSG